MESLEDGEKLAKNQVLRHLLRKGPPVSQERTSTRHRPPPLSRSSRQTHRLTGKLDLAVLRPENQTTTHVTPRIALLAQGLFRETMFVLGPRLRPRQPTSDQEQQMRQRLLHLLAKTSVSYRPTIEYKKRIKWLTEIKIDEEVFRVSICPLALDFKFNKM